MTRTALLTLSLAVVILTAGPVTAAPPADDEQEAVRRVNAAIDKGVQYLRSTYKPGQANWDGFLIEGLAGYTGGTTALAALAMLNCGVPADDPLVRSALDYLRGLPPEKTYVVALTNMVLAEARLTRDRPLVQRNCDWLVNTGVKSGGRLIGWGYGTSERRDTDNSNTQYALLGLYAGKQTGATIADTEWRAIQELYRATQKQDGPDTGYWRYHNESIDALNRPSFPMTVAGVCGLLIAGMGLNQSEQQLDPATGIAANCGRYATNDPIARGLNWAAANFAFEGSRGAMSTLYNVYGIERLGRLSGLRFVGRVDWYRDGCEYLLRTQQRDGSWRPGRADLDYSPTVSTSFALLFLSKGRTPVLISKLAWGDATLPANGTLLEKGPDPQVVGWNRKHNDARHLTEFASRELFNGLPLGWQVYDSRRREYPRQEDIVAEVGTLVQSPLLYLNGHEKPRLKGQHEEILKRYIEEGGFVLAEACCGSPEFAAGFRELMAKLFPESKLQPVPPEHPIWRTFFAVPPTAFPKLEYLDRGCRTVVIFSPEPLAGYWEEAKYMPPKGKVEVNRGEQAFRLAGNVIAYATGLEPPKQRLSFTRIANPTDKDRSPPKGFLKPLQLKLRDEPPPAKGAMRNLMAHLQAAARIDAVQAVEELFPGEDDLFKYKFMYLHGRKRFTFTDEEIENVRANLQAGGLLLADAACGKPEFDTSFRELMTKMFPDKKLTPIPLDDELYSAKLTGTALTSVKRREKAGTAADPKEGGFKDLPPALEGIKIDDRWVVIYSKYDIGCALENHKSTDCLGHDRDSAMRIATAVVLYALKR